MICKLLIFEQYLYVHILRTLILNGKFEENLFMIRINFYQ